MASKWIVAVSLILVVALAGCGGSNTSSNQPAPPASGGTPPPSIGSFTEQTPSGTAGNLVGEALVQLSDGSILVAGGDNQTISPGFNFTSAAEVLSLDASGTVVVTKVGNMTVARDIPGVVRMPDGRVLVVGGRGASDTPLATAEIYDPQAKSFSATGTMLHQRLAPAMFVLKDGTIVVIGGDIGTIPQETGEIYNPATGTFGSLFSIPSAVGMGSRSIAMLIDGRILFPGGSNNGTAVATAQIFDPQSRAFTPTGNMTSARSGPTVTTLADGKVLVAGGVNGGALASAETYDPATGTFSATGNMTEALTNPISIRLSSGKVLVVGDNSRTSELYDPSTRTFTAGAQMITQVTFGQLFLMPDGTVLLTRGPSFPFEFFHP